VQQKKLHATLFTTGNDNADILADIGASLPPNMAFDPLPPLEGPTPLYPLTPHIWHDQIPTLYLPTYTPLSPAKKIAIAANYPTEVSPETIFGVAGTLALKVFGRPKPLKVMLRVDDRIEVLWRYKGDTTSLFTWSGTVVHINQARAIINYGVNGDHPLPPEDPTVLLLRIHTHIPHPTVC